MTDVLGKPVRFQQLPGEAFKTRPTDLGMSDAMAQGMLDRRLGGHDVIPCAPVDAQDAPGAGRPRPL